MEMLLRKVLEQLKSIEKGIMKEFLENPLLASYEVNNNGAAEKAGGDGHHHHEKSKTE